MGNVVQRICGGDGGGIHDSELCVKAQQAQLKTYGGFKAIERRLVFVFGDNFKTSPDLSTILPTGVVEGAVKKLDPKKERGLVTYPYPQFLDATQAALHVNTPFVWKEAEEKYALVHMWTINYNDEFRNVFDEWEENPDQANFKTEAVENLYKAVAGMWGEEARKQKVKYCSKETQNYDRTFVGTSEQFQTFFNQPGVKEKLGISKITDDEITVRTKDKKGKNGTQSFPYGRQLGVQQVLYKRNGFTSFTCFKPLDQFIVECDHKEWIGGE